MTRLPRDLNHYDSMTKNYSHDWMFNPLTPSAISKKALLAPLNAVCETAWDPMGFWIVHYLWLSSALGWLLRGGTLTWKGDTGMHGGQVSLFQALWPFIRPPVAVCSSSEDPCFLKFLIFNKKLANLLNFAAPKTHFRPNFSSLPQKFL